MIGVSRSRDQEQQQQEQKLCRICFCEESIFKTFIYACGCKGSVKYIHEECLKTFIISKNPQQQNSILRNSTSKQKCDLCKSEFLVKWNRKYQFKGFYVIFLNEKLGLFYLLCALALFSITLYIIIKARVQKNDQNYLIKIIQFIKNRDIEDQVDGVAKDVVSITVLVLCILLFIFIFTCSSYLILRCFFKKQLSISQIIKQQQTNVQSNSLNQN